MKFSEEELKQIYRKDTDLEKYVAKEAGLEHVTLNEDAKWEDAEKIIASLKKIEDTIKPEDCTIEATADALKKILG